MSREFRSILPPSVRLSLATLMMSITAMALANPPENREPNPDDRSGHAVKQDATIKLVTLLRRRDGMTMDEFKDYYESIHARIGEKYLSPHASRYFRRYLHPVPGPAADDNAPERIYDVVMEIWFPDQAAFDAAFRDLRTAEAQEEIVADELKLFNRDYIHGFIVDEHESRL
jgi:hypothetical protein